MLIRRLLAPHCASCASGPQLHANRSSTLPESVVHSCTQAGGSSCPAQADDPQPRLPIQLPCSRVWSASISHRVATPQRSLHAVSALPARSPFTCRPSDPGKAVCNHVDMNP